MDTAILLFALRLVSAGLLMAFVLALAWLIWRDLDRVAATRGTSRRQLGHIIPLVDVDGRWVKSGTSYPLMPQTTFGRAPTNTIQVDDPATSTEHAVLAQRGEQWWLEDRSSRNGTTLNGMFIQKPAIVTDGDVIGIGKLHFKIELLADTSPS
jgi:hypothetical protein